MSGCLIVWVKIFDVRLIDFIVRESLSHIGDQHSELSSPISNMISSYHLVSHILKNSTGRLSNDSASEMTHMHLFGDVRWRKIDHNLLLLHLGVVHVIHELIDSVLDELILKFDLKKSFLIGRDGTQDVVLKETLFYFLSKFNNSFASESIPFFFVAMNIELFHGCRGHVVALIFGSVL